MKEVRQEGRGKEKGMAGMYRGEDSEGEGG